jgi:hypothetical protein
MEYKLSLSKNNMRKLINLFTIIIFALTLSFPTTQNLSTDLKCDRSKSHFLDAETHVAKGSNWDTLISTEQYRGITGNEYRELNQEEKYLLFIYTKKQEAREAVGQIPVVNFAYVIYVGINNNIDPITGRDYSETSSGQKELAGEVLLIFADTAALMLGASGQVSGVIKSTGGVSTVGKGLVNVTGKARTPEQILNLAEKFLGKGYKEIDTGVFRSLNELKQFRMTASDLLGKKFNNIPHVHYEWLDNADDVIKNYHIPIK